MESLQSKDGANVMMATWFATPETTPRKVAPCEALVRFVAKNFKPPARFLDIGSGDGADSRYLEKLDFRVISIDIAHRSRGAAVHAIGDIREMSQWATGQFDCIFDIETLQHVEGPPYKWIYRALKPGGKFFSIHIANDSKVDVSGKGYTYCATDGELHVLLIPPFKNENVSIRKTINWNGATKISCWQIEATK